MKTYVIADIHGRARALKQVLLESEFDFEEDRLITLGDICDGGRHTNQCYDLLLQIRNRIDVVGNHDLWALDWINNDNWLPLWTHQGGYATLRSYDFKRENVPRAHKEFIEKSLPYYIDKQNRIYVHGGFNPKVPIENQKLDFLVWDRTLIQYAHKHTIPNYKHVFVGHTTTQLLYPGVTSPLTFHNLTMCDCGGGWNGRLAMINVSNPERDFFLSESQYPHQDGSSEPPETEEFAWGVGVKNFVKDQNW